MMQDKKLGIATAYGYAKSKGYAGTEEEFAQLMADYAEVGEDARSAANAAQNSAAAAATAEINAAASEGQAQAIADGLDTRLDSQDAAIAAIRAAVGSPLVANTAAAMTDTEKIYVYTGDESGYTAGNWYYYDGTAWVSGGVYNSAAVETDTTLSVSGVPADAKVTGDEIDSVKSDLNEKVLTLEDFHKILPGTFIRGTVSASGNPGQGQYRIRTDAVQIFSEAVTVTIDAGYRLAVYYYMSNTPSPSTLDHYDAWETGTYTFDVNSYFFPVIALVDEDTSVPADLAWRFRVYSDNDPIEKYMVADGTAWEA